MGAKLLTNMRSIIVLLSFCFVTLSAQNVRFGEGGGNTRGLGRTVAGKLGGKIGDAVGGIAMSFASTYALGHLAQIYYDSGRTLSIETLKAKYPPLLAEGKELASSSSRIVLVL